MNAETANMRNIQKAVTVDDDVRLFRNTVGMAYQGRLAETSKDLRRVLLDPRPVKFGLCVGSSDLIGWRSVVVTPEMVGQRVAVFAAIEVKEDDGGDGTEGQTRFLAVVKEAGGISGIARNPEQAFEVLRGKMNRMFPIMAAPNVPWDLMAPHERQAEENHDQSLETLAGRGGLSPCEAVAILENRRWHRMDDAAALARLAELSAAFSK